MAKRIPISFKNTEKDMKLYLYLIKQEDKSNFVKKALALYINYLEHLDFNTLIINKDGEVEKVDLNLLHQSKNMRMDNSQIYNSGNNEDSEDFDDEDMEGVADIFSQR